MTTTLNRPAATTATQTETAAPVVLATATAAGRAVQFLPPHRDDTTTPVVVTATVTMPLSYTDLVAALWKAVEGMALDQIDPDPTSPYSVVGLVMRTVATDTAGLIDARDQIADVRPGSIEHVVLMATRALVSTAFGLPVDGGAA